MIGTGELAVMASSPADYVGYHDHSWGNVGLMKVVHDWYWARGQA
jgi:hypothetical protein